MYQLLRSRFTDTYYIRNGTDGVLSLSLPYKPEKELIDSITGEAIDKAFSSEQMCWPIMEGWGFRKEETWHVYGIVIGEKATTQEIALRFREFLKRRTSRVGFSHSDKHKAFIRDKNIERCSERRLKWFEENAGEACCAWFIPKLKTMGTMPVRFVREGNRVVKVGWHKGEWKTNVGGDYYSVNPYNYSKRWTLILTDNANNIHPVLDYLKKEGRMKLLKNLAEGLVRNV